MKDEEQDVVWENNGSQEDFYKERPFKLILRWWGRVYQAVKNSLDIRNGISEGPKPKPNKYKMSFVSQGTDRTGLSKAILRGND